MSESGFRAIGFGELSYFCGRILSKLTIASGATALGSVMSLSFRSKLSDDGCSFYETFYLPTAVLYYSLFTTYYSLMRGRPEPNEAAPYYYAYINLVASDNIVSVLAAQLEETVAFLSGVSEDKSLHRYESDKWSMRQLVNHLNDTERVFLFRALWFARGFPDPLPSYDQIVAVEAADADSIPWAKHVAEFRSIRLATLSFFQNLPEEAWLRSGIASDNPFTVRALAYIAAGHVTHHTAILRERYL